MFGEYSTTAALGETTAKLHLGFLGICFLGLGPGFFCQRNLGTGTMAIFSRVSETTYVCPNSYTSAYISMYKFEW